MTHDPWEDFEEHAPILVLRLDRDGKVLTANPFALRRLGKHITGRPFDQLRVEFVADQTCSTCLSTGGQQRVTLKTASGVPETVWFHFYPRADHFMALGCLDWEEQQKLQTDVLELNRDYANVSRQLQQANAGLSDVAALKDRFLGMAAHDIRRPLGVITTYVEYVLEEHKKVLPAEVCDLLTGCAQAAAQITRLIDDFLDVALIASGRFRIQRAPTLCPDILPPVLRMAHLLADRKGVQLRVDNQAGDAVVSVDGPKLQQVLINLLANAIEHSRSGQHVGLTVRRTKDHLEAEIRDEGEGIRPEDQGRIFAPFETAGTRKTAGERSTGLGLAIARMIVTGHDGDITVSSTPGRGAVFTVHIPIPG